MYALEKMARTDVYVLSDEEFAIVMPGLDRATSGESASDEEVEEALCKPWK